MRYLVYGFLFLVLVNISYGVYISIWAPTVWPPMFNAAQKTFYDYAGSIDVQTKLSTGSGDIPSITTAAQDSGLHFVVLTDLNNFKPDLSSEKYNGQVLVIQGGKYNYIEAQILNFDLRKTEHLDGPGRSQVIFSDLLSNANHDRDEGLFVLAHPFKPGYRWSGDYPPGLDGIELYNLKSIWQEAWLNSKLSFFWSIILYPFNSDLATVRLFSHQPDHEITLWDKLNSKQSTWGFAGSDAESKIRLWSETYMNVPSYESLFSIVRNHVLIRSELTGQAGEDRKKISEALRHGQFYVSLDILQNPSGFEAYVSAPDKTIWPLGSELKFMPDLNFIVSLPAKPEIDFVIEIYKDGEKLMSSTSPTTEVAIHSRGAYRAVVRLKVPLPFPDGPKWMNWVITNPVFVR